MHGFYSIAEHEKIQDARLKATKRVDKQKANYQNKKPELQAFYKEVSSNLQRFKNIFMRNTGKRKILKEALLHLWVRQLRSCLWYLAICVDLRNKRRKKHLRLKKKRLNGWEISRKRKLESCERKKNTMAQANLSLCRNLKDLGQKGHRTRSNQRYCFLNKKFLFVRFFYIFNGISFFRNGFGTET